MDSSHKISFQYVDTNLVLEHLVSIMKKTEKIAIDIEADSFHHYFQKVCLIQLSLNDTNYIVDPLIGLDLSGFLKVLSGKKIILHDGGYDLRMMKSTFNYTHKNIVFDTMLAGQLLGYEKLGLAALIEQFFEVSMVKSHQKADWSHRPLSMTLQEYAVTDTHYLLLLADILNKKLRKLSRTQWHRESCENMVMSASVEKPETDPNREWRIKGVSKLKPRQLAYVRSLWHWRENQAKKADLPPFKIMGNRQLLNLAVWAENNPNESFENGPKLPRSCTGRRFEDLKDALEKAYKCPVSKLPGHLKSQTKGYIKHEPKELINAIRSEAQEISKGLGIAPQTLAPRASLTAIAYNRPRTVKQIAEYGQVLNWQAQLLEPMVKKLLEKFPAG